MDQGTMHQWTFTVYGVDISGLLIVAFLLAFVAAIVVIIIRAVRQ